MAIPSEKILDLLKNFLTRQDQLLEYIAKAEKSREARDQEILETLLKIASALGVPIEVALFREVIPKPTGSIRDYGNVTTTTEYQTVAKIKPKADKKFKLTKIIVSCPEDVMYQLYWQGQALAPEIYVMAKIPIFDWYPYGYRTKDDKDLVGDGSAEIELKVKYPSGGTAATCNGEISGDEE